MNIFDKDLSKRLLCLLGIAIGVYLMFRYLLPLVIPFIFSALVAKWLYPLTNKINEKLKIPYKLAVVIVVLTVSAILLLITGGLCVVVAGQFKRLAYNMPFIQTEINSSVEYICKCCDNMLGVSSGKVYGLLQLGTDYLGENWGEKILPFVTERAWNMCIAMVSGFVVFLFFLVGTGLIMEDYDKVREECRKSFIIKKIYNVGRRLGETIGAYFKAQGIIICIVTVVCSIGLFILRNPYAVIIAIVIAVLDAFPVVGSGSILIPWALVYIFQGDFISASVIAVVYLVCLGVREILEPKIMGQQTGLSPIYMFVSFYVGLQLFGIIGVVLGPIGLVIIQTVYSSSISPNEQLP